MSYERSHIHNWRPADTLPEPGPEPGDKIVILVLLAPKNYGIPVQPMRRTRNNSGQIIDVIGNLFAFDMPPVVGWQPLPALPNDYPLTSKEISS